MELYVLSINAGNRNGAGPFRFAASVGLFLFLMLERSFKFQGFTLFRLVGCVGSGYTADAGGIYIFSFKSWCFSY